MQTTEPNLAQRPVDRLIAGLCASNAALRDRCQALEDLAQSRGDDCASMRLVCTQALTALHEEQKARSSLQERYDRVVSENRELRGRNTLRPAA